MDYPTCLRECVEQLMKAGRKEAALLMGAYPVPSAGEWEECIAEAHVRGEDPTNPFHLMGCYESRLRALGMASMPSVQIKTPPVEKRQVLVHVERPPVEKREVLVHIERPPVEKREVLVHVERPPVEKREVRVHLHSIEAVSDEERGNADTFRLPSDPGDREGMHRACGIAEKRVRALWTRGDAALRDKAISIGLQLEVFLTDLDRDPLFSRMPAADNNFYYLWMLFLNWGKPEAIWSYEECGLMGLSLEEIFIAFGFSEIESARYMVSDAAEHPRGWTRPQANKLAASHLRAVDQTLAFLDAQARRH